MRDGKIRFTDQVVDYLKYRPSYPQQVIDLLEQEFNSTHNVPVADIGAGTGIFTRQLLGAGFEVFAVEPNSAMRQAAENQLSDFQFFQCLDGSAEDTGIPDRQVELVTVAQAFHWFHLEKSREEFARITRSPHRVLLVWNHRHDHLSEFNRDFEDFLLRWCDEYAQIRETTLNCDRVGEFYGNGNGHRHFTFENRQLLNWDSLLGRVKSCSYVPRESDPRFIPMNCDLRQLFDKHQQNGRVELCYETSAFLGQLD